MRTWAAEIMRACAADTNSCGNVAVYFEPQTNCIQHATTLNPYVPYDYYLCIATVAYHTRCDASSSLGIGSVSVDTCSL